MTGDNAIEGARAAPFVKSADRVLDVLEYLAEAGAGCAFSKIAIDLGVPKSSLSQLLGNLIGRGYVRLDGAGGYWLADKCSDLAARALSATPFRQTLRRALEGLRDDVNETSAFYVRRDDKAEVLESIRSRQALVFMITVGDRIPLYAHSAGKIILAHMEPEEFELYLQRVTFERFTAHTIHSKEALRAEVDKARREGFAYAFEELSAGIKGMATAVALDGRLFGALNVAVPLARYTPQLEGRVKAKLPRLAAELAQAANARRFNPD